MQFGRNNFLCSAVILFSTGHPSLCLQAACTQIYQRKPRNDICTISYIQCVEMQRTHILCVPAMKWASKHMTQGASLGHPSCYERILLVTGASSQPIYNVGRQHSSHLQLSRLHHPCSMDLNLKIDTRLTAVASKIIVIHKYLSSVRHIQRYHSIWDTCMSAKTKWITPFADFDPNSFLWIQLSRRSMTPS